MRRMMTEKEIATVESLRKDGILSLKDAHGNPRFVEGDITMETIEGVTQTYGKWSLSGTHLMIVLVFTADANTILPSNSAIANVILPNYIFDRITPLDQGRFIEGKAVYMRGKVNWWQASYTLNLTLGKNPTNLYISTSPTPPTIDIDTTTRIQFDLLIDVDYDE
jgi:hypothetical protein